MQQDTLIGKKHEANKYTDPLRFKRRAGFYVPTIAFTTKEGRPLQENGTIKDGSNNEPYIEYLIKTSADNVEPEEFRTVPFSEWSASDDGYFYLRGTNKLGVFMNEKEANGVILINIHAQPIKIGLDYQGGGDLTGTDAPKPEDILNIPAKQLGGKNGYNVADNKSLLISNSIPVDKKNEFLFDHWEIIETTTDDTHPYGQLTDVVIKDENNIPLKTHPGSKYSLESDTLKNLANAFYLDGVPRQENTRAVLTLRAVWKKESNIPTIPYMIRYVLADVKDGQIDITSEQIIEERAHTVNKGAMLVTDLYQDDTKTLSANIQNILEGENQNGKDYTEEGLYEWVVYEPQTTRKIESVSVDNNVATIYLIKGNTSIDVNKVWDDPHYQESEVNVQLQRRSDDNASWETTANKMVALNQSNNWNYTFNVPAYYDINSLKQYQYRVVELDSDNNVIENANQITLNDHTYQVQYTQKPETNTWEIKNTRLLDLTISKVVDGKFGDRTKNFTFDISTTNSDGTPLNGNYKYEGSIKNDYEQQATNPGNGTINFTDGKGQFSLSHGQQLTIKNLPVNCLITITEQSENDYSTKYLVNGKDQPVVNFPLTQNTVVDVTNTRANAPDTGLNNKHTGTGFMIALGIIGISFLVYLVIRKRKGSM